MNYTVAMKPAAKVETTSGPTARICDEGFVSLAYIKISKQTLESL